MWEMREAMKHIAKWQKSSLTNDHFKSTWHQPKFTNIMHDDMTKRIQVPRSGSVGKACYQSSGPKPAYAHMCVHIHINVFKNSIGKNMADCGA